MVKSKILFFIFVLVAIAAILFAWDQGKLDFLKTKTTANTPIYVTFFSHNEEGDQWLAMIDDEKAYKDYRSNLISEIKLIKNYGATLNWETDWSVLMAMQKYEKGELLKETNNKNILKWMTEDMGVVVDPHGHLTKYNLADVAYLIRQFGVEPSTVVGGFAIYKCSTGDSSKSFDQMAVYSQLEMNRNGLITGRVYKNSQWTAKILGQPGMQGHGYDEFSSGVWRPDMDGTFTDNDSSGKFIVVGQGYPHNYDLIHFGKDRSSHKNSGGTTIWYKNAGYITELNSMLRSKKLPDGKIYTASISVRDSKLETDLKDLENTLKTLKPLQESGEIIYMDYENVAKTWKEKYAEVANRVDISKFSIYDDLMSEVKTMCLTKSPGGSGSPTEGKCGDGKCEGPETGQNCPTDCQETTTQSNPPTTKGSCGDGTCDSLEQRVGLCPQDCK